MRIERGLRTRLLARGCRLTALVGGRILLVLPPPLRSRGTAVVAEISWRLSRAYRPNAIANLRQVLGPDAPPAEIERLARAAFRTSARNIELLLWIRFVPAARLAERTRLARGDWTSFDDARARGRGVVVLTGHIGAFDLLAPVLAARGGRVTVAAGRTLPAPLHETAVVLRSAHGIIVAPASTAGARQLVAALEAGGCVVVPGDRDFFGNGAAVRFFGRPTTLPSGAARLARATGAVIIAAAVRRTASGYAIELDEPFTVACTPDRAGDIAAGMERITELLARAIAAAPGDWAVFQPVWSRKE